MTSTAQKFQWSGVMPAITTPLKPSGDVDITAAIRHACWMIDEGCNGIVIGGSLGEGQSLTTEEKIELWRGVSAALLGRAPVIAAIGSASTLEACLLAQYAANAGCSGLMVLPPYVHSGDEREAIAHIESVARATNLPVMVYNNPQAYRADFSAASLAAMAMRQANIRAVKDSTGDVRRIAQLVQLVRSGDAPSDLTVFVGLDDVVPSGVGAGAKGWIAGLANALPAASVALWKLAVAAQTDLKIAAIRVAEVDRAFLPLLQMDIVPDFVQRIKLVQALVGRGDERVRTPRLALEADVREACITIARNAIEQLDRLGIPTRSESLRKSQSSKQ
ncbi:MAG: dihydrodipicolinate synthase family protein [Planctomycetota bacterium]|nr:dihydrodipicolinate synthase family protein [Planctomycetota bacterium]